MEEGVGIPQGSGGDIRGLGNILPDRYVYRDPHRSKTWLEGSSAFRLKQVLQGDVVAIGYEAWI